jgi:hypothetical protein
VLIRQKQRSREIYTFLSIGNLPSEVYTGEKGTSMDWWKQEDVIVLVGITFAMRCILAALGDTPWLADLAVVAMVFAGVWIMRE